VPPAAVALRQQEERWPASIATPLARPSLHRGIREAAIEANIEPFSPRARWRILAVPRQRSALVTCKCFPAGANPSGGCTTHRCMKKQKSGLGEPLTGHAQPISIHHALLSCMCRVLLQIAIHKRLSLGGLLRKALSHPSLPSAWRVCPAYVTHAYLLVPYAARLTASQVTIHGMPIARVKEPNKSG
jgi:hypothetical protein